MNTQIRLNNKALDVRGWAFLALCLLLLMELRTVHAQEIDEDSGFIKSSGWELVNKTCTRCHSAAMVTQNAGSEAVWKSRILWMQETQGLEQLAPLDEQQILAYLAKNYGQRSSNRRAALSAELLPQNPYESISDE